MSRSIRIDLWTWSLEAGHDERQRLARHLTADELARAGRYHFARDREQHVVARGRLRELLAARVGSAPGALRFAYSAHGKPTLVAGGPAPHFNLSHARGLAALAISDEAELGLDIEAIEPLREDLAEHFFSRSEVAALRALPGSEQLRGFYRCWTRKEAVLKSLGDGLSRALDSFDVSLAPDAPVRIERMDGEPTAPQTWQLLAWEPAEGFAGAIALRTHGAPVSVTRHTA